MKITVEFDLTPQEFRQSLGWPDVSDLNEQIINDIREKMTAGVEGYDPMSLMKPFIAQSTITMEGFQKAMMSMMDGYFSNKSKDS